MTLMIHSSWVRWKTSARSTLISVANCSLIAVAYFHWKEVRAKQSVSQLWWVPAGRDDDVQRCLLLHLLGNGMIGTVQKKKKTVRYQLRFVFKTKRHISVVFWGQTNDYAAEQTLEQVSWGHMSWLVYILVVCVYHANRFNLFFLNKMLFIKYFYLKVYFL